MKPTRPISLILLADIQVGKFGINQVQDGKIRDASDEVITFTKNLISQIIKHHGLPSKDNLYALFALGDIASTANPSEYEIVCQQLLIIAIKLRIPLKRMFFCPGNHDFYYNEDNDNEKFKSYFDFNNYFFSNKLNNTYKNLNNIFSFTEGERNFFTNPFKENGEKRIFVDHQPNRLNYFEIDSESGLEVLSFNSAHKCKKDNSYGHFPYTDIVTNLDNYEHLEKINSEHVRIAIGHHNFEAMDDDDTSPIRNVKELKTFLFENNFRFFLHGHQHMHEYSEWVKDDFVVSTIGCGSVSASNDQLPAVNNQMTILKIGEAFAKTYSHIYNPNNRSWSLASRGSNLPLPMSKSFPFDNKHLVSRASRDLIKNATKNIHQTFILSAFPKREDDPVLNNDVNSNISITRTLSLTEYAGIEFAKAHIDLEDQHDLNLDLNYVEVNGAFQNPFNYLFVDDLECLISLSKPDIYDSSAIYLKSEKAVSDIKHFVPHYRSENRLKLKCKLIDSEVLRVKSEKILESRPFSIANSFITSLMDQYKMKEEISYLGIVGSSTKENIPGTRLNDIDILLIVKDQLTSKFIRELKQFIINEVRERNNINGTNIVLIPEYRDAPLRPAPQGTKTVYQLHILLHEDWQPQEWPAFIRKTRLLSHLNIKGEIKNYVTLNENLFKEMVHNDNWSFEKMKEYCIKEFIPCRKWDIIRRDDSVFDNFYKKFFKESWEVLEFIGYCCIKSFLNILIAMGDENAINYTDEEIIDAVKKILKPSIIKMAESVLNEKKRLRMTGVYKLSGDQLSKHKDDVISVLDYLNKWVLTNHVN